MDVGTQIERFQEDLRRRILKLTRREIATGQPLPETLYHYTNISGLLGILQSGSFWASDRRLFNDKSEVEYGANLAHEILKTSLSRAKLKTSIDILEEVVNKTAELRFAESAFTDDLYVISFTEDGDLLSQWRGYGEFGRGVSIGIDTSRVSNKTFDEPDEEYSERYTFQLIYEEEVQRKMISNAISKFLRVFANVYNQFDFREGNDVPGLFGASYLSNILTYLSIQMKHPSFSEEREWRLVQSRPGLIVPNTRKLSFRTRESTLIPYVPIFFGEHRNGNKIPIEKIILGPLAHISSEISITKLLTSLDYELHFKKAIKKSIIPFTV